MHARALRLATAALILVPAALPAQTPRQEVRQRLGTTAGADTTTAVALSAAFRAAAERALPAVVFIAAEQEARITGAPRPRPRIGSGSGVIIDASGHVLTNNHVVADATRLTVRLVDGREYAARLIGGDVASDIAVIRIEPRAGETFPTAALGDSDDVRVGDWVLALGSPLGLDFSVTAGIVSAKGRSMSAPSGLESFIQTDAVINPGNSGGPLIDLFGRVVGINAAILGSETFVGYGFAVPVNIARRVVRDLLEFGFLRRPRIGLQVRAVDAVVAEAFALPEVRGAFVAGVEPDGTARAAGIRAGDVVIAINGTPIRDDADFIVRLAEFRPSQEVTLRVIRESTPRDVRIRLGEWERTVAADTAPAAAAPAGDRNVLGFTLVPITPDVAAAMQYRGEGGMLVTEVSRFGPAAGFVGPNQVILAINGRRVRTPEDVRAVLEQIRPGDAVAVTRYDERYGENIVTYRTRP
jgi:serine protease Do